MKVTLIGESRILCGLLFLLLYFPFAQIKQKDIFICNDGNHVKWSTHSGIKSCQECVGRVAILKYDLDHSSFKTPHEFVGRWGCRTRKMPEGAICMFIYESEPPLVSPLARVLWSIPDRTSTLHIGSLFPILMIRTLGVSRPKRNCSIIGLSLCSLIPALGWICQTAHLDKYYPRVTLDVCAFWYGCTACAPSSNTYQMRLEYSTVPD